jgi:hypothetical protein
MQSPMKTLVWDQDDVLNDLMRGWLEAGSSGALLRYEEITENPPHRLLGITRREYEESLDAFRLSADYANLRPLPQVIAWFKEYGHLARHIVVSAVPLRAAHCSSAWLFSHYGRWIRTFHVVPSPRQADPHPAYDGDKAEFLRWLGKADLLIDDSEEQVAKARSRGIRSLVFPRPWNRSAERIEDLLALVTALIADGSE